MLIINISSMTFKSDKSDQASVKSHLKGLEILVPEPSGKVLSLKYDQ